MNRVIRVEQATELRNKLADSSELELEAGINEDKTSKAYFNQTQETLNDLIQALESDGLEEKRLLKRFKQIRDEVQQLEEGPDKERVLARHDALQHVLQEYYGYGVDDIGVIEDYGTVYEDMIEIKGQEGIVRLTLPSTEAGIQMGEDILETLDGNESEYVG